MRQTGSFQPKPEPPRIFPGERGFKYVQAKRSFDEVGGVTKICYRFLECNCYYVDLRDLPAFDREDLDACPG